MPVRAPPFYTAAPWNGKVARGRSGGAVTRSVAAARRAAHNWRRSGRVRCGRHGQPTRLGSLGSLRPGRRAGERSRSHRRGNWNRIESSTTRRSNSRAEHSVTPSVRVTLILSFGILKISNYTISRWYVRFVIKNILLKLYISTLLSPRLQVTQTEGVLGWSERRSSTQLVFFRFVS